MEARLIDRIARLAPTALLVSIAVLWASPPVSLAQSAVQFEDPAMKGSLTAFDYPTIPPEYHGTWADRSANCYATSDRGRQVTLSASAIGFDRLLKVEGYSDHPAVLVTAQSAEEGVIRVFLDISLDRSHIEIRRAGADAAEVLIRCPPPSAVADPASIADDGWLSQAEGACQSGEFGLFLEAFMSSEFIERRYLAPRIRIVTPAKATSVPAHQYRPVPIRSLDYSYVLNDGSFAQKVSAEFTALPDGGYRLDWRRTSHDPSEDADEVDQATGLYGPPGWLIFERTATCWQLAEDGTGF